MGELEIWLRKATRGLAADSAAQVRREIGEHYESAREAAVVGGSSAEEADRLAMRALGDARMANCQYRKVLLTSGEARLLREGKREARAVCSRPWLKWLIVAVPVALVEAAAVSYFRGNVGLARDLLFAGIGMSPLFAAILLPINTPLRGRVYRYGKWVVMTVAIALLFGPEVSEVVVVAAYLLLADCVYGLDAGFDTAEAAGFGVASAFVSLSEGGWEGWYDQLILPLKPTDGLNGAPRLATSCAP